ncbi:MAG: hypothetical protein AB7N76_16375 [Planctomycetota bacterium]
MGRIAHAPEVQGEVVLLAVSPGTGHRAPRSAPPLRLLASGPQFEPAKALSEGQAVLLRGQLRQDDGGLSAHVQAIELLVGEGGHGGGGAADASGERTRPPRKRRRRRREPRGPREGGEEGGAHEGGAHEGGEGHSGEGRSSEPVERAPRPAAPPLPPPKPIAVEAQRPAPPPDPSFKTDMPF